MVTVTVLAVLLVTPKSPPVVKLSLDALPKTMSVLLVFAKVVAPVRVPPVMVSEEVRAPYIFSAALAPLSPLERRPPERTTTSDVGLEVDRSMPAPVPLPMTVPPEIEMVMLLKELLALYIPELFPALAIMVPDEFVIIAGADVGDPEFSR
ncbi:hypothetical protein [Magnetospirillum sp. 15-1]|uniref:hypothetical protein n=1 Tax=Magnetospirillum sp. 15-1 TaxID=1979370 RepID=UPI0014827705|nr:hypothetical protein [Magnetospirillum sp. 15-1]